MKQKTEATICRIILAWFVSLLGIVLPIQGQHNIQLHFRHLSREDGFTPSDHAFFYKDTYGLVWLSSGKGLNYFDGQKLSTCSELGDEIITSPCLEDKNANLWFSTKNAIYCYQRSINAFKKYQIKNSSLQSNYYAFHLNRDGRLWIQVGSNEQGLLYLFNTKDGSFKPSFPLNGDRHYVILGPQGTVDRIVSTSHSNYSGLRVTTVKNKQYRIKEFIYQSDGNRIKEGLGAYTNGAFIEGDSIIWVGVYKGLGVYYPQKDTAWIIVDRSDEVKVTSDDLGEVWDIVPYSEQYLLVSTERSGLLLFDKKKREFVNQIGVVEGLKTNSLKELYVDKSQNIWISETDWGLAYANLYNQKIKLVRPLMGKYIKTIYQDKGGDIWCSTIDSGMYLFNQDFQLKLRSTYFDNQARPIDNVLPNLSIFFEEQKNGIWAIYFNNLLLWDGVKKQFRFKEEYFLRLFNKVNHFAKTKSGKPLVAIGNKIFELKFTNQSFNRHPFLNLEPYQLHNITTFYPGANGYFFIADDYRRLLIVQEKNDRLKKVLDLENIGECHAFYETKNKIWIATSKGLYSFDQALLTGHGKNEFQPALKLPQETFYSVIPDAKGYLWLTSNNGLVRYHIQQKRWDRFSQADGLQSQEFSPRAWLKASNGEIWLGGPNGLNVFHPDSIQNQSSFPPLMIERIKVNDLDYKTGQNVQLLQKIPKLHHQENTLSFDFLALEYNDPEAIQLKYRLRGQDETWVEAPNPGFVRFSKLPPGAYTLEVIATNSDGIWMPEQMAKQLSFFIPTPWWRTWWFYALCIAVITAIAYGIFNYRLQQALKIERIRVRISSDLHDDVGTLLSGLAMQSEILELTAPEKTKPKLQRISELSRSAMSRMRDTVWAIDARKDKLENLIDRMREHAEETLTPRDILLDLQVDQLALNKNVPSQIRQALYLIYKEAITNCAKHSKGDKVSVRLQKFGTKGLEMSIHDNGEVQQKAYKTTGSGLSNMRMRAEQIGGTFQVDTSQGFLITVQIPHFS